MKLINANDIELLDDLYIYSNPKLAQKNAFELFGKNGILYKSTHKGKKYMIYDPFQNKFIHFGSIDYEDYLKHNNDRRRNAYLSRALNIRGNWAKNPYSPNSLAINILWN